MSNLVNGSSQALANQYGLKGGDHVYVKCLGGLYTHHGVYCGDGKVVHYDSSWKKIPRKDEIRETALAEFVGLGGRILMVVHYECPDPPAKIIARARRRVGERRYHLLWNNCEHFATWCVTGSSKSSQVPRALQPLGRAMVRRSVPKFVAKAAVKTVAYAIVSPWVFLADGVQVGAESLAGACGASREHSRAAGRTTGLLATTGIGAVAGGPIGAGLGVGLWLLGELLAGAFVAA